jgi:hypothetical protein
LQIFQVADSFAVKFDGAKLPAILNSLETDNNGQKLILEVSVWHNWNFKWPGEPSY